MVTKSNTPIPPAPTGLKTLPKIEPAELATNATGSPKYQVDPASPKQDLANKDRDARFKMPDKLTQGEIRDNSFKYGGGRSAGNRSLEANRDMQKRQP